MAQGLSASTISCAEHGDGRWRRAARPRPSLRMQSMTPYAPSSTPNPVSLPPLRIASQTIGVVAIGMVGSSISSQLVDLAIADVGGALSVSSDEASWIACIATMAEVVGIPLAALLVRALSLRVVVIWT